MSPRTAACAFALVAFIFSQRAEAAERQAVVLLSSTTVLARYERAMEGLRTPKIMRFEYAVEQVGPHNLSQTHRVYRSALDERDEILSVDGQPLPMPSIRIIRDRVNRYNVVTLAPRLRDYDFTYVGTHRDGAVIDYVFKTAPHAESAGAYQVVGVAIEGVHFLPRLIAYSTVSGDVRGHGTLTFWRQDKYWVVAQATASVRIAGKIARERLTFHNYDFPASLPNSTFSEPRGLSTPIR
ncbi:MAG: hypothetical protein JO060_12385 [Candidatus Eremiobacteraeota bacterium]|nr:hypothetical protein [Candidatus Eremiobacteraeota bacterium]MBV9647676.1 hypothetical protein [Candidatus Eremiobacteraeota bacterium]